MKQKNTQYGCSRRRFLAGSLAGIGSIGALGALTQQAAADTRTTTADTPSGEVLTDKYRQTGMTQ